MLAQLHALESLTFEWFRDYFLSKSTNDFQTKLLNFDVLYC